MPDTSASQAQSQTQSQNQSRSHGQRRGRGGKGKPQVNGAQAARGGGQAAPGLGEGSRPPASSSESQSSAQAPTEISRQSQRGSGRRGRGRQQQAGRGGARGDLPRPPPHRAFGGHLTTAQTEDSTDQEAAFASLSADAPEFVPGQPVSKRTKPRRPQAPAQPKVKVPKSTASDLGTRIHEDISNFNYECSICTDDVVRTSQVWSCNLCWTTVHLKCAKRWHDNQKKQQDLQSSEALREPTWRCPGCNSKLTDEPGSYSCWCGKEINPQPAPATLPPHSCGQTCSKPRGTCPHPCPLQCHAGPCPPCGLMGPTQSCFCGKNTSRKLCRETDYESGWSCQEVCGDLLPCGEHFCSKPCHTDLCGDCDTKVEAKCYCGRIEKDMPCFEREDLQQSYKTEDNSWFEGSFACGQICNRDFDCGHHKCSETCHPQEEHPAHCPRSPDVVTRCPCGKTALEDLLEAPRQSCEDTIPHCEEPCNKKLKCGHLCKSTCHTGDCSFCRETIDISCVCGRTSSSSMCHQGDLQHPMCFRVCQANLSCGRHKCGERCCPGEKRASERQAARRKHKLSADTSAIEAEHICIKTCGRTLKCGSHQCQQMCHRGPCGSCPEAIFTEISCDCGRTVLQPPQPCGTHAPECRFNCLRRPECGHPPVEHNCHSGETSCPKCPFLVEKWCACGKDKLHSQPCHLQEAHCGRPCGKKLKCGLHNCRKLCHRPGACEDSELSAGHCDQSCGKVKLFCEHPCQQTCHGQTPCNETSPCTSKAIVSCPCGIHQQEVRCLASSSNPTPPRPEIKCDDECLRLERNRRLANALNIDPATHQNDHVPYSDTTLQLFKENLQWAETQEREFRVFSKSSDEVRLRYKPMVSTNRQFLHSLAEDYGLESRSEDVEPHRYVVVFKGPRFVSAPSKTLAQCVKIRKAQASEAAAAAAAAEAASREQTPPPSAEPFNGFLLTSPRFGLTIEEVNAGLAADMETQPSIHFSVSFLPSEEVLLRASTRYSSFMPPPALEAALTGLQDRIEKSVQTSNLASKVLLCHVDSEGHVVRRGGLVGKTDASGWSAVAGRAASRPDMARAEEPIRPGGRKLLGLRRKKVEKEPSFTDQMDGDVPL